MTDEASSSHPEPSPRAASWVARALAHCLDEAWRTPGEFLDEFPPARILEALAQHPALRAKLLVATTGVHEKIATKKSVQGAAEDLALALDEGITTPSAVLEAFPADVAVAHLGPRDVWAFVAESRPWLAPDGAEGGDAAARLAFLVEAALDCELVTLEDVFDGLTVDEITSSLPVDELRAVLAHALRGGRHRHALDETRFLEVVPLGALLGHVPTEHAWERVVVARIAGPSGLSAASAPTGPRREAAGVATPRPEAPAPRADEPTGTGSYSNVAEHEIDVEVDLGGVGGAPRAPYEDAARTRVVARLGELGRLPPRHACLSLQNLLSIEALYTELPDHADEEARERLIRDAFPNDAALRASMLALIELLDPTIDTHEPVIRDADSGALIKVVLFEEKLRAEGVRRSRPTTSSSRAAAPPPPAAARPPSSLPPPPSSLPPPSRRGATVSPLPPPPRSSAARASSVPPPRHVIDELPLLSIDELEDEVATGVGARVH